MNKFKNNIFSFWKKLGPGLITGAADDDPSGVATYSQTGAQFGMQFLWITLFAIPFMILAQEMCARIGLVTNKGLAANIKHHYSKSSLFFVVFILFFANTFNIGANLNAMAACVQLFNPHWNLTFIAIIFALIIVALQIFVGYKNYSRYLKYSALILFVYILTVFFIDVQWHQAWLNLIPTLHFDKKQIILLCALLGTTISPYLFFWQASQEIEEKKQNNKYNNNTNPTEIYNMRIDTWIGMIFSNLVAFFIIIVCASTLYTHGITNIETAVDAASALKPFAGRWAEILFALGIISTGMLSIPTLAGSSSYAIAEAFNWKKGLDRKWYQAYKFYCVILISILFALTINFIGLSPIRTLIYSAILNGVTAPILLYYILRISNNKKVMGQHVNGLMSQIGGWCLTIFMALTGLIAIFSFLTKFIK